jgi:hypothetical protein
VKFHALRSLGIHLLNEISLTIYNDDNSQDRVVTSVMNTKLYFPDNFKKTSASTISIWRYVISFNIAGWNLDMFVSLHLWRTIQKTPR